MNLKWNSIFLSRRFFVCCIVLIFLFVFSYPIQWLYIIAIFCFFLFTGLLLVDFFLLYSRRQGVVGERICPSRLSNGDDNEILVSVQNKYAFPMGLKVIDEVPIQFQARSLNWDRSIVAPGKTDLFNYTLRPTKRGEYDFGVLNVFVTSPIKFVVRRYRLSQNVKVPVYPSFLQMRKYEIAAFTNNLEELGIKKIRRIGQTLEFEQIKEYVQGDDPRNINWKATARKNELMVNQFVEERSQPVYTILDKGRLMRMPFDGLTLVDYVINAALVISNIALKKQDKAGLITFGNKLSTVLLAEKKPSQIYKIQEVLYNQRSKYLESNFELLSSFVLRRIRQRSLLLLYTNFESFSSFKRQLPYFRTLARRHLLVVIFFENTGLKSLIESNPENTGEVYQQIIAEKSNYEKVMISKELKKYGIFSILTTPSALTIDSINKYLEIKARGML